MKLRDNETLLKKLTLKLETAQKKVDEIQLQIDNVNRDVLDPPIKCCGKLFKSHQDLRNHNNTKSCSNKFEPYVKCKMCRNTFYGLTKGEVETLGVGNIKFDISDYGKHYRKCFSCLDCGYMFKSFEDKKYHLKYKPCNVSNINQNITDTESESSENNEIDNDIKKTTILRKLNYEFGNLKMDIEEDNQRPPSNDSTISSGSELETESFYYDGYTYEVDYKNRVYDKYGEEIGKRYKNEWNDWKIEYK
tara:strand:- start:55 stop:798 length:744 start_codon:yes stop_codon:yes gene_type:complete